MSKRVEKKTGVVKKICLRVPSEIINEMTTIAHRQGMTINEVWLESARRRIKNSDFDDVKEALQLAPEVLADRLTEEVTKSLIDIGEEVRLTAGKHLEIAKALQNECRKDMNKMVEEMFEMTKRVQDVAEILYQQANTTKTTTGTSGTVLKLSDLQTR